MNAKKTVRIVLDAALTVMIVFEMLIQYTGDFLHEVVGFAFFATVITHLLLSARWMKATANNVKKGKVSVRQVALIVIAVLLAVCMLVLGVSSVAISGLLAQTGFKIAFGSYATWATIHAVSSYALCAIVAVHLGLHWVFIASAFHVPYDASRRRAIGAGVNAIAAVGAVALGVMAVNEAMPHAVIAGAGNGSGNGVDNNAQDGSTGESANGSAKRMKRKSPDSYGYGEEKSRNRDTGNSNGNGTGSANGSSNATGICTLCRKQCPLSAPQCDKPYLAGIL